MKRNYLVILAAALALASCRQASRTEAAAPAKANKEEPHKEAVTHWTAKTEQSARREIFYYDETDLMAIRVDAWKMHIGLKKEGSWWNEKYYPSVPYFFNLLMDPLEKMDPQSKEYGYIGRQLFAQKMWAATAAGPFIAAHLQSLEQYPPRQKADTLSLKKALEGVMAKLENAKGGNQ